jgi:hypothetical protein
MHLVPYEKVFRHRTKVRESTATLVFDIQLLLKILTALASHLHLAITTRIAFDPSSIHLFLLTSHTCSFPDQHGNSKHEKEGQEGGSY